MKTRTLLLAVALLVPGIVSAAVPPLLHHQGRIVAGGVNFNGNGLFKFALIDSSTGNSLWSNDGTSVGGSEPAGAVTVAVSKGQYSVLLGDTALANMTAIPASVFATADVRLRIWFNDGTAGSQQLAPDRRLAPAPYAHVAGSANALPANTVTSAEIVNGSITGADIAASTITGAVIANNTITNADITDGTVRVQELDLASVDARYEKLGAGKVIVDATGGGDFTSIGAALAAIAPAAGRPVIVEVRGGTYIESVTMKSHVHLKGVGAGETVLQPPGTSAATARAITATALTGSRVSGLTISERAGGAMDPGIYVNGGALAIEECDFEVFNSGFSPDPAAIRAGNNATITVRGCRFSSAFDETAVLLEFGSFGVICENHFAGGGPWIGVRIRESSKALIEKNRFQDHDHAIRMEVPGPNDATIVGNHFLRMAKALEVQANSSATLSGNRIDADFAGGSRGVTSDGRVAISGNTFAGVERAVFVAGEQAMVTGNEFYGCGGAGGIPALDVQVATAIVSGNSFRSSASLDIASPGNVRIFHADGAGAELVPGDGIRVFPQLIAPSIATPLAVGATPFTPIEDVEVRGRMALGDGFTPDADNSGNFLNLLVGSSADGAVNGITFFENNSGFGMSLGYDGTGSGTENRLHIYSSTPQLPLFTFENGGNLGLGVANPGAPIQHSSGATLTVGGAWADASSVALKENFTHVDRAEVLEKLARLPITRWKYKSEPATTQHIGPMAEDFHAAFGLGGDDRTISGVDRSGVALIAIQELYRQLSELRAENRQLQNQLQQMTSAPR